MSELKTEFNYTLTTGFTYSSKGDQVEAQFIQLTAPSSRNSKECSALKQAFFRALPKDQGGDEGTENPEISGDDIITMIAISEVDLPDIIEVAKRLFTSGNNIALVDGEAKLTQSLLDKMSQDDLEIMTGEYIVNFILASSLKKMREQSSKVSSI